MTYEGALWFPDLTASDPFMALPIICAGVTLVQFNSRRFQDAMVMAGPGAGAMKPLMNFMAVLILVFGYFQPSAIALLWSTNSVMTIGQNTLLNNAGFRKRVGLPPVAAPPPGKGAMSWASLLPGQKSHTPQPVAAAAAGAPPPGTPVAVNYVAGRPGPSKKQRSKVV
jgi:membrane protein insertase Oxa1/YidC/SpoIIIJ